MRRTTLGSILLVTMVFAGFACGNRKSTVAVGAPPSAGQGNAGELHFKAPDGWVTEKASSSMRVAQYTLPKAEGDNEDGSAVLYYFGATQGGTPQANIDRWINQMQQPDNSASKEKAKTDAMTVNGLKISTVDVAGTYTAEMAPGSGTFHNNANYRLRAAVIETAKGNYFLKVVGPAKTMARWEPSFTDYLKSFDFK